MTDAREAAWDEAAWGTLEAELARWRRAGRPATFWWRDDDAGRDDPALERLLAVAARTGVPLGVAVVPAWLEPPVSRRLEAAPGPVRVLQHGFAHANHETVVPAGERKVRPAECGVARPLAIVLAEIAGGQARLHAALATRVLPLFVPPWNRIAPAVRDALPGLGYAALSTFGPRTGAGTPGLVQLNCHVDPVLWREDRRFVGAGPTIERLCRHLVDRRTGTADPTEPTGLLTHHRDLSPGGWAFLDELLARLGAHPAASLPPIESLAPRRD